MKRLAVLIFALLATAGALLTSSPCATVHRGPLPSAAAGAFDPTLYGTVALWLKADDIAGADNSTPASWPDASANARNFSFTGSPTLQTNEVNGHNAMLFDPSNYGSKASQDVAGTWGITNAFTVFSVHKTTSGAGVVRRIFGWLPVATNAFQLYYQFSDNKAYLDCGDATGTGRISGTVASNTAWKVVCARRSGTQGDIWEDGTNTLTSSAFSDSLDSSSAVFSIFDQGGNYSAELLIYSTAVSSGDRVTIQNALKAKYGTP